MKAALPTLSPHSYNPYEKPSALASKNENRQGHQFNERPGPVGEFARQSEQVEKPQLTHKICDDPQAKKKGPTNDIVIPPCEIKTYSPWLVLMPKLVYPITEAKLHDEILAFQSWAMLTPQEAEARRLIVDCIHTVVKRHLNDGETLVFGSCATSLALPSSDIDIVVSTKEIWTEINMKLVMSQLAILLKVVGLTKHVVKIPSARVPILKFTALSEYGSFGVDISINNTTGLQAVNVVNDYLSKMPALRPLVLAVKALLAKYGLNNPSTGGLGSYAVICMCIFFIKTNPSRRPLSFYDLPLISGSLGTLLSDFLWYFSSEFPYSTSCISAKDGCLYPSVDSKQRIKKGHCMSVQCLLNPETNVAKSIKKKTLKKIVNIFQKGFTDIVQSSVHDKSILGQLFEVEEGVLQSRAQVQAVMESGTLSALSSRLRTSQRSGKPSGVPLAQSTPKIERDMAERVEAILSKYQTSPSASRQANIPLNQSFQVARSRGSLAATRAAEQNHNSQHPYSLDSGRRLGSSDVRM